MKTNIYIIIFITLTFLSCEKPETFSEDKYSCQSIIPEEVFSHPKAALYQEILNRNQIMFLTV